MDQNLLNNIDKLLNGSIYSKPLSVWIIKYKGKPLSIGGKTFWKKPANARSALTNYLWWIEDFSTAKYNISASDVRYELEQSGIIQIEEIAII